MMTNKRQFTVYQVDARRQDRQFHPYRRPIGYDRFTSVPQISAERQWLMSFIVVSRREVMGTSHCPLSTLWFWPQEETVPCILSRTSYCKMRRNRRYHPYKRPGKYFSEPCKYCSLLVHLDCRYFSVSLRRYIEDNEASTAAVTDENIKCPAIDTHMPEEMKCKGDDRMPDAQFTQDVKITINKTPKMTAHEFDKQTSEDVVSDSMTDWTLNLLTDSDLQQMRKTEWETIVADLGSTVQSKTNTEVTNTSFGNKHVSKVTTGNQFATTNVSTNESVELHQISQQDKALVKETWTAVINESNENQHENDKIEIEINKRDTEDDCCKMNPTEEDLLDRDQYLNASHIDILKKIKEEMCSKKSVVKQVMDEVHQPNSTTESAVSCTAPTKACKKRMSAAMFFKTETTNHPKTSNTPTCTDCNLPSSLSTEVTGLNSNKTQKSCSERVPDTNLELHPNNSLCVWLRKDSSSSEPYKASNSLSDQERLIMRKRRFGMTDQSEEKSTRNLQRDITGDVPHATTKRRKIRLSRF